MPMRPRKQTGGSSRSGGGGSAGASVARVTEISAKSPTSFEDAIQVGIDRANQTLRHVNSVWVKEQQVNLRDGKVTDYQVNMLVTFVLE